MHPFAYHEFKEIDVEENRSFVTKAIIKEGFVDLGIKKGDALFVHCSIKSFGFVCGGAQTIIESLMETVGEEGTLVMPTQSWKNLDPSTGVHWEEPEAWWDLIRANWPAYNKDVTPTNTMGAVAEIFRKWEGTERSNHPARSVAAWGKYSKFLIENHDLSNIFGIDSPIHKFYNLDGKVLLLGVGYDKNISLHLADVLANYPSKKNCKESSAVFVNGKREWVTYETLYVDGEDFEKIGQAFEEDKNNVSIKKIGDGEVRLMNQKQLVDFAVKWIEKNRKLIGSD